MSLGEAKIPRSVEGINQITILESIPNCPEREHKRQTRQKLPALHQIENLKRLGPMPNQAGLLVDAGIFSRLFLKQFAAFH